MYVYTFKNFLNLGQNAFKCEFEILVRFVRARLCCEMNRYFQFCCSTALAVESEFLSKYTTPTPNARGWLYISHYVTSCATWGANIILRSAHHVVFGCRFRWSQEIAREGRNHRHDHGEAPGCFGMQVSNQLQPPPLNNHKPFGSLKDKASEQARGGRG